MKIALYVAFNNSSAVNCCKDVIDIVSKENDIIIDLKIKNDLDNKAQSKFTFFDSTNLIDKDIDFVFAVGGDGTILRSITYVRDSGVPILGINSGRLGFLTSVQKDNVSEALVKIKENKFSIVERTLLELKSNSSSNFFSYALNEVTIQRKDTTSLLNILCSINDDYLTNYWSDGLIISTPTGSTGYSLSNGGSLVSPESKVIILNPIAPHNINMRSLIIPDHSEITIKVEGTDNINLSLDSRMYSFDSKNEFKLSKSQFVIKTIKLNDDNFYKRLREKLFWGQDMRNKKISD